MFLGKFLKDTRIKLGDATPVRIKDRTNHNAHGGKYEKDGSCGWQFHFLQGTVPQPA